MVRVSGYHPTLSGTWNRREILSAGGLPLVMSGIPRLVDAAEQRSVEETRSVKAAAKSTILFFFVRWSVSHRHVGFET